MMEQNLQLVRELLSDYIEERFGTNTDKIELAVEFEFAEGIGFTADEAQELEIDVDYDIICHSTIMPELDDCSVLLITTEFPEYRPIKFIIMTEDGEYIVDKDL